VEACGQRRDVADWTLPAHCHGQDADGGEDAPSLLKLQISGAHMALVIQSGIKDEMPSFAKKYNEQDTAAIVAYLKTLH
jgi:mono/diheme cytochrome c family protein